MISKQRLKDTVRHIIYRLPRFHLVYLAARRYVYYYQGDGNLDARFNGERRLVRDVLSRRGDAVAFDVGANLGDWTQEVLAVNPAATIHCFEPALTTFSQLTARGFPSNVICNQLTLGDALGEIEFFVHTDSKISSIYPGYIVRAADHVERVKVTTVDDYCARNSIDRIDFLKIDVEGHDLAVLKGARAMLAEKRIGCVQFEYRTYWILSRTFLRDVFEFIAAYEYDVFKVMPYGLMPVPAYRLDLEQFRISNYLLKARS